MSVLSELTSPPVGRPCEEQPRYLPEPAEIAEVCEQIRAGWSPAELNRRMVDDRQRKSEWSVPAVTLIVPEDFEVSEYA